MGRESELEKQANRLLRQAKAAQDPEYPAYSEHYLAERDKSRAGETSLEEIFNVTVSSSVCDLFEVAWHEIRSGAALVGCSARQIKFLELRRWGLSYQEIADLTGWSVGIVYRDLQKASKTIQRIPYFGLWTVLSEAFRVDISQIKAIIMLAD